MSNSTKGMFVCMSKMQNTDADAHGRQARIWQIAGALADEMAGAIADDAAAAIAHAINDRRHNRAWQLADTLAVAIVARTVS